MNLDAVKLLRTHHHRGVVVDANLLLLWLIGRHDRELIGRHKRTAAFTPEDFDLLDRLVRQFQQRYTTPHVLTEVSNLAGQVGEPVKFQLLERFWTTLTDLSEKWTPASEITRHENTLRYGLTDAACAAMARQDILLLSVDYRLVNHVLQMQLPAVNFNHLRRFT